MIGIGDMIVYDTGVDDSTTFGIVQKIYWDSSIGVLDPYALDGGKTEYHIIERDMVVQYWHRNMIDTLLVSIGKRLSKLMPLEFYIFPIIGIEIIIYIAQHLK